MSLHPSCPRSIQPCSGPIAQLDRVPDYESGGRGFESSSVRHHILPISAPGISGTISAQDQGLATALFV